MSKMLRNLFMRKSLTALLVGIALAGNAFAAEDKPITIAIAAPGEVVEIGRAHV